MHGDIFVLHIVKVDDFISGNILFMLFVSFLYGFFIVFQMEYSQFAIIVSQTGK